MPIKFINAKIFTLNDNDASGHYKILDKHNLIVDNNKIVFIGDDSSLQEYEKANHQDKYNRVVDCNENLLMPTFKNAHTHSAMTFLRSYADDLQLLKWLDTVQPLERQLTDEDAYYFTTLALMEYLSSGTSYCADMFYHYDAMSDAIIDLGFRASLVCSVSSNNNIEDLENEYLRYSHYPKDKDNLIDYKMGLHAEYTNNIDHIKKASDIIHKYKEPFYTHLAETKSEVDSCIERYNMTPAKLFETYGLFDFGGGGYHSVYLSDDDIDIYKRHNVYVITNPCSNLKLASGIAPIKKYIDNGLNICIGTDGPASNNALDMFREMYLVSCLSKAVTGLPDAISVDIIFDMAIKNPAIMYGKENTSCLKVGNLADIQMIDLHKPNMQPENSILSNIIYSADKTNVKMTMVNGKILYEDGEFHIHMKEQEVYDKCNSLLKSLKER